MVRLGVNLMKGGLVVLIFIGEVVGNKESLKKQLILVIDRRRLSAPSN